MALLRHERTDDRSLTADGQRGPSGPTPPTWGFGTDLGIHLAFVAIFAGAALAFLVWLGAQLAAITFGGGPLIASRDDAVLALVRLPSNSRDPARAWPSGSGLPGPVAYWACTGVVFAVVGVFAGIGAKAWMARRQAGENPLRVRRPGGLAVAKDLRHLSIEAPQAGRLSLGTIGRTLIAAEPQTSLAVVGPTGCGKTAGFAIPALLEWEGPILATSVKNDLLDATLEHRRRMGKVWIFDPTGVSGKPAAAWSPLAVCTTWSGAQRVSAWLGEAAQARRDSVTDGDYWQTQARKGLAPYLHAAAISQRTMADVVRWIDTQEVDEVEEILGTAGGVTEMVDKLQTSLQGHQLRQRYQGTIEREAIERYRFERLDPSEPWTNDSFDEWPTERQTEVREQVGTALHKEVSAELAETAVKELRATGRVDPLLAARALWVKESRLRGSVFATIENVLNAYADPEVAESTGTTEIDIDEWLGGNNTIYVVATAHEQARLRPVLNVLIQQAIRTAYETATVSGGTLEHPCLVLLDEAGNIAPLRDLPGYASTARSHGISFVTIWQDLAQIKSIYGDRAQTVLNNHRAKLFGTGIADEATLDYLSRLIGERRRTELNQSGDLHSGRRSVSEHTTYRRTATADILRRVEQNHALLVYGRDLPAELKLRPWFKGRMSTSPSSVAQGEPQESVKIIPS